MPGLLEIPVEQLGEATHTALLRLHLKLIGDTTRFLIEFQDDLTTEILRAADEGGTIDLAVSPALEALAGELWEDFVNRWLRTFQAARRVAAWLPFGQVARLHTYYFGLAELGEQFHIGFGWPEMREDDDEWTPVFKEYGPVVRNASDRVKALLDGGAALRYSDGHTLSDRVWRWGSMTNGRIQQRIRTAAVTGDSAWNLAQRMKYFLRAGNECPRWTSTRLRLTKSEIAAGNRAGLKSGHPCEMKGVAYASLRLARNEIQIIHNMATDEVFGAMPWVQRERIKLSPSHPPIGCECEDVVVGGSWHNGTYPVGQIVLPIHIQCLCYKTAALMHPNQFVKKARAWMRGEESWPAMDAYGRWLQAAPVAVAPPPPPKPPPEPEERPGVEGTEEFPASLSELEKVRDLGGSTGAELVRDAQGRLYVRKRGASADHLREEMLADSLYREAGVNVPKFREYTDADGRPVKLAQFVEGDTLGSLLGATSGDKRARLDRALGQLRDGLAIDALLGNWDVVGMDFDNVLVDADGNAWRIDNGGSLRFRAMGRRKTAQEWQRYVGELWSLRDPDVNPKTAQFFGEVSWQEIVGQIETLGQKRQRLLDMLHGVGADRDVTDMVRVRLDEMLDLAGTARTMVDDEWKWDYVEGFCKHLLEFRLRGITTALPERLTHRGVYVKDQDGFDWDHLRGRDSVIQDVDTYMRELGGSWDTVAYWMGAQAGTSWSSASKIVKWHLTDQRTATKDRYLWLGGEDSAENLYNRALGRVGEQKFKVSYQVLHAFTYEMLHQVEFEHNLRDQSLVEVVRTESRDVMSRYGMKKGQAKDYMRGACESSSIYQTVVVAGDQLVLMRVPHHRFLGSYFGERTPGSSHSPFLGDGENEFVGMFEGVPAYYYGTVGRGQSTGPMWRNYPQ